MAERWSFWITPIWTGPGRSRPEALSDLLDADLGIMALITQDLVDEGVDLETGRPGMTGEQTLRAALYRHLHALSYEALAFHLADSRSAARFCRLQGKAPSRTGLQRNIRRIKPETWEALNRRLVLSGRRLGVERGHKVRVDCTVVASPIHHPTDSSLLDRFGFDLMLRQAPP